MKSLGEYLQYGIAKFIVHYPMLGSHDLWASGISQLLYYLYGDISKRSALWFFFFFFFFFFYLDVPNLLACSYAKLIWDYGSHTQTVGLLGRVTSCVGRPLPTQDNTNLEQNADRYPWFEWDSNSRSQRLSGWRNFTPYTARLLWSTLWFW
jgi:hypothetical protein